MIILICYFKNKETERNGIVLKNYTYEKQMDRNYSHL